MSTKTTVKTNETATNTPPTWAQPGLEAIGNRITQILPTMPGPRYEGDFIAQPGQMQRGLIDSLGNNAGFARLMTVPALGAMSQLNTPVNFQMPGAAPVSQFRDYDINAIRPVIEAATQPAFRQLTEQVLPGLQSAGIESGAYGNNRSLETLPALAIRDSMRQIGEIGTGLAYQDFTDMARRQLEAYGLDTQRGLGEAQTLSQRLALFPDLLDTVMRTQTGATDIEAQAASLEQQLRQQEIDNQLAKFDYGVRYPYQGLDVAAALLGQIGNPWGTRTSSGTQTQSTGGLGQFVQGAMGLGMAAAGLPGGISSIFRSAPRAAPISITPNHPAWG